jgi:hypothetical protein
MVEFYYVAAISRAQGRAQSAPRNRIPPLTREIEVVQPELMLDGYIVWKSLVTPVKIGEDKIWHGFRELFLVKP